jgi:hypothetical protein
MNYWVDLQFLLGTYFWREDFKRPLGRTKREEFALF